MATFVLMTKMLPPPYGDGGWRILSRYSNGELLRNKQSARIEAVDDGQARRLRRHGGAFLFNSTEAADDFRFGVSSL